MCWVVLKMIVSLELCRVASGLLVSLQDKVIDDESHVSIDGIRGMNRHR